MCCYTGGVRACRRFRIVIRWAGPVCHAVTALYTPRERDFIRSSYGAGLLCLCAVFYYLTATETTRGWAATVTIIETNPGWLSKMCMNNLVFPFLLTKGIEKEGKY